MSKKNAFKALAFYMMGFGATIGVVFPFFVMIVLKIPSDQILTPTFFFACISAGLLVGLFNIALVKRIIGLKISLISEKMLHVQRSLLEIADFKNKRTRLDEEHYIQDVSDDAIGGCAESFNSLLAALSEAFNSEANVRKFTEMLSSRLDLDELAEEALNELMGNLNALAGSIIIELEGELKLLSSFGIKEPELMLGSELLVDLVKEPKKLNLSFPDDIELNGILVDFRPKSVLVEPILYKGVFLGIVVLAGMLDFTSNMQRNMDLYGKGLALAFNNAIAHDQLQKFAATDPLMGILNRRYGLTRFKEEFNRSTRTGQPLGVIMFDIDHFKHVNDTYGHLVGDRVLINLAKAIKTVLREGDIFIRYGGEEFLAIFPGASLSDLAVLAERVRRVIEEMETSYNLQKIKVTVSVGGASYPEHDVKNSTDFLEFADQKLYQAKDAGRNIVMVE